MFKVFVKYPAYDEEYRIAESTTSDVKATVSECLSAEEILKLQHLVRRVPVPPHVIHYALRLVRRRASPKARGSGFRPGECELGRGTTGHAIPALGGKARAVLEGRFFVTTEDVRAVALPVLRHRVITNFAAESAGLTPDKVIERLVGELPARRPDDEIPPAAGRAFALAAGQN